MGVRNRVSEVIVYALHKKRAGGGNFRLWQNFAEEDCEMLILIKKGLHVKYF